MMINSTRGFEIRIRKNELREQYKLLRRKMPQNVKEESDKKICSLFLSSITYRYAKVLLLYAPTADEIDISSIARQAFSDGKTVAFPRCNAEKCTMEYHIVKSLDELQPGAYRILEPSADSPVYRVDEIQDMEHPVCLIPGLVFDGEGYRIGYGKGYYDRYLALFPGVKVGTVYHDYVLKKVPRGRFDLSVDIIVTEKGVRAVHAD